MGTAEGGVTEDLVSPTPALLITGGTGQLGRDLVAAAGCAGVWVIGAPGSAELDVTDAVAVGDAVAAAARAAAGGRLVVINTAAYTAVDAAEGAGAARAYAVNARGAANLARACATQRAHLIQVSTDYVFAGDATRSHRVDDPTAPRTVYGRSKLAGEQAVLRSAAPAHVVRTAWLYGAHGRNFVRTMAAQARAAQPVRVVTDQRGNPTWAADLAEGLIALAQAGERIPKGVLHCVNTTTATWFELARAVFAEAGADPDLVRPCRSTEYPRPAPRPANSALDTTGWTAAGLPPLRPWRAALRAAAAAGVLSG